MTLLNKPGFSRPLLQSSGYEAVCHDTPVIVWTSKDTTTADIDRLKYSAQSMPSKAVRGSVPCSKNCSATRQQPAAGRDRNKKPRACIQPRSSR